MLITVGHVADLLNVGLSMEELMSFVLKTNRNRCFKGLSPNGRCNGLGLMAEVPTRRDDGVPDRSRATSWSRARKRRSFNA